MGVAPSADAYVALLGKLGLPDRDVRRLTDEEIVYRLVESGASRLSSERIVAVARGHAGPGRARIHSLSRPSASAARGRPG